MLVKVAMVLGVSAWLAFPARANPDPGVRLTYDVYAAGLHVAEVETRFATGPWTYQMDLAYHTTGLTGFFYRGHQVNAVNGTWKDNHAEPASFDGLGVWRGEERIARIDYDNGSPIIRQLIPPNEAERQLVPPAMQANSIDTLSALLALIRTVARTGRCELTVRTYDGRRATEIEARTAGDEILPHTGRSTFEGHALRCDFAGRMLAGFKFGDNPADVKPLHGSAWLTQLMPGGPVVPVHMTFETRWFGDATMYLTSAVPGGDGNVARN